MDLEQEFKETIADIILSTIEHNSVGLTKAKICADGHFSPEMLTREKLTNQKTFTSMRLILCIRRALPKKEAANMLIKIYFVFELYAEMEDGTVEVIINGHKGSPIKKTKQ